MVEGSTGPDFGRSERVALRHIDLRAVQKEAFWTNRHTEIKSMSLIKSHGCFSVALTLRTFHTGHFAI
jgi:hypothetical protein